MRIGSLLPARGIRIGIIHPDPVMHESAKWHSNCHACVGNCYISTFLGNHNQGGLPARTF